MASVDLVPNEDADANIVVTELQDWEKQDEQVQKRVEEVLAGEKLDAVLCVAGGWAGGSAKSKSKFGRSGNAVFKYFKVERVLQRKCQYIQSVMSYSAYIFHGSLGFLLNEIKKGKEVDQLYLKMLHT